MASGKGDFKFEDESVRAKQKRHQKWILFLKKLLLPKT